KAVANQNSNKINPTQNVRFSVQATAPSSTTGSPFTWTGAAFNNINCQNNPFPAPTSQPTVAVTPAIVATTTTVSSSSNPSTYGQSVTFTATVAPASGSTTPTGSVVFTIDGRGQPAATLNGSGQATFATST